MKKIFYLLCGLISLLGVSSCDDVSTFNETEEFFPYGFFVKDATTIQIVGYKGLVIEEVDKTDWQLYVQFSLPFVGNDSLVLDETEINLLEYSDKNSVQLDINTNMAPISNEEQQVSFAVSGLNHPYTYMGEQMQLQSLTPLKVKIDLIVEDLTRDPFFEKGTLEISLIGGDSVCLIQKSVPFIVAPIEYYQEQANK